MIIMDLFDCSASISFLDVRENLPHVDPENLSAQHVLEILLFLFNQKPGFVDRGHELNNRETAWVNGYLFRLGCDDGQSFVVETVGSSVDKISALS